MANALGFNEPPLPAAPVLDEWQVAEALASELKFSVCRFDEEQRLAAIWVQMPAHGTPDGPILEPGRSYRNRSHRGTR